MLLRICCRQDLYKIYGKAIITPKKNHPTITCRWYAHIHITDVCTEVPHKVLLKFGQLLLRTRADKIYRADRQKDRHKDGLYGRLGHVTCPFEQTL